MKNNQLIRFDKKWNKSTIKNLVSVHSYLSFSAYPDCKALCITPYVEDEDFTPEYEELTYIVPKDWLTTKVRDLLHVSDVDTWLRDQYTTEDSEMIFSRALQERQVIMVDFI